jgi:secondary thiamine-phosphate synthase enzyme
VNITSRIEQALEDLGAGEGFCLVSVPHTTCALVLNEAEQGLMADFQRLFRELLSPLVDRARFAHDRIDHNARAHLVGSLLGTRLWLEITGGKPLLGTWQRVLLVEGDGPRERTVRVSWWAP